MPVAQSATAFAHFFCSQYDEASSLGDKVLQESPNLHQALRVSAASHALGGRLEAARKSLARLRQVDPVLRISNLKDVVLFRSDDLVVLAEGLRRAGLPE